MTPCTFCGEVGTHWHGCTSWTSADACPCPGCVPPLHTHETDPARACPGCASEAAEEREAERDDDEYLREVGAIAHVVMAWVRP